MSSSGFKKAIYAALAGNSLIEDEANKRLDKHVLGVIERFRNR